jgi:hypothetical protein
MNRFLLLIGIGLLTQVGNAQSVKLGYFTKVPKNYRDCGALYTYDSIVLEKKKFIFLSDFQNLGLIIINGKQVKLLLQDSKTVGKENISVYSGGGYTVTLTNTTTVTGKKLDLESGWLEVKKGKVLLKLKVHGESGCDEESQEKNLK